MSNANLPIEMLLLEPSTLLRRTVALTARSLGVANVHEASTGVLAQKLLRMHAFDGLVIAIDVDVAPDQPEFGAISLLDLVRSGQSASKPGIPIAVLAEHVDATTLKLLQQRGITRLILKPFRARALIETLCEFGKLRGKVPAPAGSYRIESE